MDYQRPQPTVRALAAKSLVAANGAGMGSGAATEQVVLGAPLIDEGCGLFRPRNRQSARIQQAGLDQDAGLVPVDVLVADFSVLESDHHNDRDRYPAPRRRNPGEHDVERTVMGEGHHELVDNLVLTDRPRELPRLRVAGPLADEVVAVEVAYAGRSVATRDRGHVVHVGALGHCGHRRLEIEVLELGPHVGIENRSKVAHVADLPSSVTTTIRDAPTFGAAAARTRFEQYGKPCRSAPLLCVPGVRARPGVDRPVRSRRRRCLNGLPTPTNGEPKWDRSS